MSTGVFLAFLVGLGLVAYASVFLWVGAVRKRRKLRLKDERRHAEELEWKRSGYLPDRYETVYKPGEMVDEDVARMEELGYYVAGEAEYVDGSRRIIYRRIGVRAL